MAPPSGRILTFVPAGLWEHQQGDAPAAQAAQPGPHQAAPPHPRRADTLADARADTLADALGDALADALGDRIEWAPDLTTLLAALNQGPWAATLLGWDGEVVDLPLARRIAQTEGAGVVFLMAPHAGVEAILQAEAAGAAALLPFPPAPELVEQELVPLVREPGVVKVPPAPGGGPSDSGGPARGTSRGGTPASRHHAGSGTPEGDQIGGTAGDRGRQRSAPSGRTPDSAPDADRVVGSSPAMVAVYRTVVRVASAPTPVLIHGESGTGKELVARALHRSGAAPDGPFVPVNCAALPESLLEAELFGYERGAFTGAVGRSLGRFGRADGGTLFLDEVGEMSLPLQAKLLRVLETGEVERLGADKTVKVKARVVAATNRDLRTEVEAGRFREDLFYRMAVVELTLPPLRERPEDLLPLAFHFVNLFGARHGRPVRALSRPAVDALESYSWPGNVRELRNVLDRAVLLARGGVIRGGDLRLGSEAPRTSPREEGPPGKGEGPRGYPPTWSLAEVEAAHIRAVLLHTQGHMGEAAEILGIHRNTMTVKVRDLGIDVELKRLLGTDRANERG